MRKIAVVTGSRADYGLLYWTLKGIQKSRSLKLQLIVTGMHLSPKFGSTVRAIEKDGFPIAARVPILAKGDNEQATAVSMGVAVSKFAKVYPRLKPDLVLALGDRFEIFAAVAATIPFRIPVAHIHGGESTEGAFDEFFRHAMTKMSYWHFATMPAYARRIIQMGEEPGRVFSVGAPGLDFLPRIELLSRSALAAQLRLPMDKPWGLVTFHPVTLERNNSESSMIELVKALKKHDSMCWVFTYPNADTGHQLIIKHIRQFVAQHPTQAGLFSSLGSMRYLSLLKHASLMVGNSSSGIIEAPSFKLPVVNIGDRQKGRVRAANVIDVPQAQATTISSAIRFATSITFRKRLARLANPYGQGNTSQRIVKILERLKVPSDLKKHFHDLPFKR